MLVIIDSHVSTQKVKLAESKQWSEAQIMAIYQKVCAASGQCDIVPGIRVVDSPIINAYCTQNGITLFTGLLNKMQNEDEIALIIGHEMSHYLLGHVFRTGPDTVSGIRIMEMQADKYGAILMMRAGYDICKGRVFMRDMLHMYGDNQDEDHPDFAFRFNQLNVNCGEI